MLIFLFFFLFVIAEVLKQYGSRLSDYERQEIEKYPEIWYLGLESCKINAKPGTPLNCGYDDENGSYNKVRNFGTDLELAVVWKWQAASLSRISKLIRQTKKVTMCMSEEFFNFFNCQQSPSGFLGYCAEHDGNLFTLVKNFQLGKEKSKH